MPPWLSHISNAQRKESNISSSRWIQLATIGLDNIPRVRTVVFRGWSESYEMEIFFDKRSQKFQQINFNNNVEICWLFSRCKCQFRLRGISKIVLGKDNLQYWNQLNEKNKSMWNWPKPGNVYVPEVNRDLKSKSVELLPENFALLKVDITHVDQLLLNKPIHMRRKWIKKQKWIEERINP
tara:strand:- start:248 stop:790 length:543 start_codon:yes stop_codon:yes gene_type:complete